MSQPASRFATYEDLFDLPEYMIGEILHGQLITQPRPGPKHARSASILNGEIIGPFDQGRGGPGGWWIWFEPELHLGPNILVPDLAGWRRERMPVFPDTAFFHARAGLGLRNPLARHRAHRPRGQNADLRAGRGAMAMADRPRHSDFRSLPLVRTAVAAGTYLAKRRHRPGTAVRCDQSEFERFLGAAVLNAPLAAPPKNRVRPRLSVFPLPEYHCPLKILNPPRPASPP